MKLPSIIQKIEISTRKNFSSFDNIFPFGAEIEFEISSLFNQASSKFWRKVDPCSGEIVSQSEYKPGEGLHWGFLLFNVLSNSTAIVILDPEIGIGFACFDEQKYPVLSLDECRTDFYQSCAWELDGCKSQSHCNYIESWMDCYERLSGMPRLEV